MKICPNCRTTYDDFQNFCLKDGTPLYTATTEPQQVEPLEPETVVQAKETSAPVVIKTPNTSVSAPPPNYPHSEQTPTTVKEKSSAGKIVALTALTTILLVAVGGGVGYLIWKNSGERQITQANTNVPNIAVNANKPRNSNAANTNAANANAVNNVNANSANTNANANVAPSPAVKPEQANKIRQDVNGVLNEWKRTTENGDLDSHVGLYATNVDYYNGGIVTADKVRSDRQKAFEKYPKLEVSLSNIKISPDSSGEKATAIIDKAWRFENDEKVSEGKVQQQITLSKLGSRWYISGEKDLQVYYKTDY